jgi:leucyl-tRNA synthetase
MEKEFKNIVVMFPYPSGSGLHCGHWYNYAIIDSYCRYQRFIGNDVFQPFGYDAFGLPAENYAKQVGREPKDVTYENIDKFRLQMKQMNTQYEEMLITSDESYQKQTQWFLLNYIKEVWHIKHLVNKIIVQNVKLFWLVNK